MKPLLRLIIAAVLAGSAALRGAPVEITILGGQGVQSGLRDLARAFERATEHTVVVRQATDLAREVERGTAVDLVAADTAAIDDFIARSRVLPGTRTDFARAGVGVVVRAGAPKPDISTPDAYRRTLLAARSIAYSRGNSGRITDAVVQRLGIADAIRDRTIRAENVPIAELVARGEAEIGMHQINVILPVRGAQYVGPLPPGLHEYVRFSLGVLVSSRHADVARAFAQFAASPESGAILRASGMEPWSDSR